MSLGSINKKIFAKISKQYNANNFPSFDIKDMKILDIMYLEETNPTNHN